MPWPVQLATPEWRLMATSHEAFLQTCFGGLRMYLPRERREERCWAEGLLLQPTATWAMKHVPTEAGDPGMEVIDEIPNEEVNEDLPPL